MMTTDRGKDLLSLIFSLLNRGRDLSFSDKTEQAERGRKKKIDKRRGARDSTQQRQAKEEKKTFKKVIQKREGKREKKERKKALYASPFFCFFFP